MLDGLNASLGPTAIDPTARLFRPPSMAQKTRNITRERRRNNLHAYVLRYRTTGRARFLTAPRWVIRDGPWTTNITHARAWRHRASCLRFLGKAPGLRRSLVTRQRIRRATLRGQ